MAWLLRVLRSFTRQFPDYPGLASSALAPYEACTLCNLGQVQVEQGGAQVCLEYAQVNKFVFP